MQGSTLVYTVLFVGFINDLPRQIDHCKVILFADDFKEIDAVACSLEHGFVQSDLSAIVKWSEISHLPLSIDKCVYFHYDANNKKHSHHINEIPITDSDECTDFDVLRTADFKYKNRCSAPQSCAAIWYGS